MPDPARYQAFISYSHAADGALAQALQQGLHRLAKPWWRPPAIRVFRDQTSLAANAALWPEIERQLARSDWLVLMASPEAASSPWVARELQWWLDHRPVDRLLIVVSGGELAWDAHAGDFDWARTSCLPPVLRGHCRAEPLYVDLRWVQPGTPLNLRHPRFRDAVLSLAAPLHGLAKDTLDSDDLRQHRRLQQVALGASALLGALVLATGLALWSYWQASGRAQANWREARSRALAAHALSELATAQAEPLDLLLRALMAWRLAPTDEARDALTRVAAASPLMSTLTGWHSAGLAGWAFSADSQLFATLGQDGSLQVRQAPDWQARTPILAGGPPQALGLVIAPDNSHVLAWAEGGAMVLWQLASQRATPIHLPGLSGLPTDDRLSVVLSPGGRLVAAGRRGGGLWLWDVAAGRARAPPPALARLAVLGLHFDAQGVLWLAAQAGGPRLLRWDPQQPTIQSGPAAANDFDMERAEAVRWAGAPSQLLVLGHLGSVLFDIDTTSLALRRMARLEQVRDTPCHGTQLLQDGRQVLARDSGQWLRWRVPGAPTPATAKAPSLFGCSRFSPDGRWRADTLPDGWQAGRFHEAGLAISALDGGTSTVAARVETACNFRDAPQRCVQQLCTRLAPWLDEARLRKLFGIENHEVMLDRYQAAIGGPLCPAPAH